MTEDIHKVDRPVFDPIRIRQNQENQGNLQKRRGQPPKNQLPDGVPEEDAAKCTASVTNDSGSRLLDIQV